LNILSIVRARGGPTLSLDAARWEIASGTSNYWTTRSTSLEA